MMDGSETFPRDLRSSERELLEWVLPADRPGYRIYRHLLNEWKVKARGRRGEGNYILAAENERPDLESPLPQLLALGMVRSMQGTLSVLVRERLGDQLEFEISTVGETTAGALQEGSRWTLSTWLPGLGCPACGMIVREVVMSSEDDKKFSLAICPGDRRLWVHSVESGINHPIPVTNFYNELMLHKNIRDPKVALDPNLIYQDLSRYSDRDLTKAFISYNGLRTKVLLDRPLILPPPEKVSFLRRVTLLFQRTTE